MSYNARRRFFIIAAPGNCHGTRRLALDADGKALRFSTKDEAEVYAASQGWRTYKSGGPIDSEVYPVFEGDPDLP